MKITIKVHSVQMKLLAGYGSLLLFILFSFFFVISFNFSVIDEARVSKEKNVHFALLSKEMKINVIQVQQWLTDISATRARSGLDDGFQEAEKNATEFRQRLAAFHEMPGKEGDREYQAQLNDLGRSFEEYYEIGKKMAGEYIERGTDAGNLLMGTFDPYAVSINEKIDAFEQAQVDELNQSMEELVRSAERTNILLLISSISLILWTVVISTILSRNLTAPIKKLNSLFLSLSDGDLKMRAEIKNKDEIGQMASHFNATLDTISALVSAISREADGLSIVGIDLSTNMTETAAAIHQIDANIQSIKAQTIHQAAGVTETNAAMTQIIHTIESLNANIDQQAASVTESSAAVEEMLANIASVSRTLTTNARNVAELSAASEKGQRDLSAVSSSLREVAKESQGLLEISAGIQNIASQTNILSMNAAIEAAHAGEAGRGFAVVAGEIRKLAESSGTQAKRVSSVLKKIKGSLEAVTAAADGVLNKFESINTEIKMVSEQERSIQNAMEEQSAGGAEILKAIGALNDITDQVKSGSGEMLIGSQEVLRESGNLGRITEELTGGMNEIAAGIEQITKAVNTVNDISRGNKESIDVLTKEVRKFKIES